MARAMVLFERQSDASWMPTAFPTAFATSSGSPRGARSTHQAPSGKSSRTSAATWSAKRVLPQPPRSREGDQPVGVHQPADELHPLVRDALLALEDLLRCLHEAPARLEVHVRNENGVGTASPSCAAKRDHSIVLPSKRGGVPVFSLVHPSWSERN